PAHRNRRTPTRSYCPGVSGAAGAGHHSKCRWTAAAGGSLDIVGCCCAVRRGFPAKRCCEFHPTRYNRHVKYSILLLSLGLVAPSGVRPATAAGASTPTNPAPREKAMAVDVRRAPLTDVLAKV